MTLEVGPARSSLVERVKAILLQPGATWDRIDGEPATVQGLFMAYAVPLAAIGPVCLAIGAIVFGWGGFGIVYHPPILSVIVNAVVSYLLSLASVFALGLIIEALAPNFGGTKDRVQAMKVAVYGSTASWLAGVFGLVPMLAPLGIVGLYSLYLIYRGLPKLMKTPQDKGMTYTVVVILVAVVLAVVVAAVLTPLRMMGYAGGGVGAVGDRGTVSGQMKIGGATVDLGKLQAASAAMQAQSAAIEARTAAIQAGATPPAVAGGVAPDALQALLPASFGGFTRGDVSSESTSAVGLGASHAQAEYARGDAHMTVEITDMAAMGGLAALAGAVNVNSSKQTATGYERVSTVGGRMTTEEYDRSAKHGKFAVMAGSRFMLAAEGDNVSIDDLKAAVNAIGVDRVEHLARG